MADARALVEFLARTFAEDQDEVEVADSENDGELLLLVDDDDLGRVIGRRGKTAKAIRTLLAAAGSDLELEICARSEADED